MYLRLFGWLACVTFFLASPAHAATYYVSTAGNDGNPGTQGSPFLTIGRCATSAVAGDTCVIGAGLFRERITFPTSGTSGNPITFQGTRGSGSSWDTIVDGSSSTSGWSPSSMGNGVYEVSTGTLGFTPMTLMSNNRVIWRINDDSMAGNPDFGGTGEAALTKAANATVGTAFGTVNYWDGIEALFGNLSGTVYLRFRNGNNPSTMNVRGTPNAATLTVDGRSWLVIRDLRIIGGLYQVLLSGGTQNIIVEDNTMMTGIHRVVLSGAHNNMIRDNRMEMQSVGTVDFTPGDREPDATGGYARVINRWLYDQNKFLIGRSDSNDAGILVAGGSSSNTISGNEIHGGIIGIKHNENSDNTFVTGNIVHNFADSSVYMQPDSASAQYTGNLFYDSDHHFRFDNMHRDYNLFIYANRFHEPCYGSSQGGGKHLHFSPAGSSGPYSGTIWAYQNSFAGCGWAADVGLESSTISLPNVHILNNILSTTGLSSTGNADDWELSSNFSTSLWNTNTIPTFVLPSGHAALNSAPSLSPRGLPGMTAGFYVDGLPDYGAIQAGGTPGPGTQPLSVSLAGNGTGSVSSSPAGITCGGTCVADFTTDALVTLTATPTGGSTFAGWSGEGCSTGQCQVTMSQPRTVTATFTFVTPPPAPPGTLVVTHQAQPTFTLPGIYHTNPTILASHPLLAGLRSWWRVMPHLTGGLRMWDLQGQAHLDVLLNPGSVWAPTARPGGHGELQMLGMNTHLTTSTRYGFNGPFSVAVWARAFDPGHLDLMGQIDSGWTQGWGLWKAGGDGRMRCAINNPDNAALSITSVPLQTWVHWACTWDGGTLTLYRDGVFQSSIATGSSYPTGLALKIGALPEFTESWWFGAWDSAMMFDRALSASHVQALYSLSVAGDRPFLREVRAPYPVLESAEPPPVVPAPGNVRAVPRERTMFLVP